MSNPNRDLRRRKAFEEYYKLPLLGIKRNPNAYYEWCIKRNREHPELRSDIPTTNRATVYEWAKDDKWDEECMKRDLEAMDASAITYADLRKRGYDKLNAMIEEGVTALHDLITTSKDERVRHSAIQTLFDRVGMTAERSGDNRHIVGTPTAEDAVAPPLEGTEDDMILYLSAQAKETN